MLSIVVLRGWVGVGKLERNFFFREAAAADSLLFDYKIVSSKMMLVDHF